MIADRLKTLLSGQGTNDEARDTKVVVLRPRPQRPQHAAPLVPHTDAPDDEPPPAA